MAFVDKTDGGRIVEWATVPMEVTLIEACNPGDLLACDGTGWTRATNDGTTEEAMLIAGMRSATGDASINVKAYGEAIIDFTTECTATVGDIIYCGNTEGTYTATEPTGDGYRVQPVGYMLSARKGHIKPSKYLSYIASDVEMAHGKALRAPNADNKGISIKAHGATAMHKVIEVMGGSGASSTVELGFFGVTPVAQQAKCTSVAAVILALNNLGLTATA